jgi:cation transport protein ChaC
MPKPSRQMRLSQRHLDFLPVPADNGEMPAPPDGMHLASEAELDAIVDNMLAQAHGEEFWVFAYGSLIWRPASEIVEMRTGLVRGWHRSFCLGWNTRFRGSEENPGLMLALDHGGACKGVLQRLPPHSLRDSLRRLAEREMSWLPTPFPPRWVNVRSGERIIRALTFCIDRKSGLYVSGLDANEVAEVLAKAVGQRGSMAEYLYATVAHLEEMGIHDPQLWQLQNLVAQSIEATYGGIE